MNIHPSPLFVLSCKSSYVDHHMICVFQGESWQAGDDSMTGINILEEMIWCVSKTWQWWKFNQSFHFHASVLQDFLLFPLETDVSVLISSFLFPILTLSFSWSKFFITFLGSRCWVKKREPDASLCKRYYIRWEAWKNRKTSETSWVMMTQGDFTVAWVLDHVLLIPQLLLLFSSPHHPTPV